MDLTYKNISKCLKKYKKIIIMTHKNIDLDGLSSSVGLSFLLNNMRHDSYVFKPLTDDYNINKALSILNDANVCVNFIDEANLKEFDKEKTALVIIDTHKKTMVEYPKALTMFKNIIVLDHHIKGNDAIENTILSYINANMSSMAEFITGFYKYRNKSIDPSIATIMLAGMTIDTGDFKIKVTPKTYENASILLSMGANFTKVISLLQENKKEFIMRNDFLKNSYIVKEKFMICLLDEKEYSKKFLAQVADTMLKFQDIEASFTIGYTENKNVSISARSIGIIDVQEIMKEFGGGGHKTDAACQIENQTIEDVRKSLEHILEVIE